MALAGSILGAASALLLLLLLRFWEMVVQHESMAQFWVGAGILMALVGTGCGILGTPRLRIPAILSGLLLPFWGFAAALLLKAALD
jgi:Na+-translocating ferredoxin:NAD+ oxidoreductase RnfA subunit